MSTFRDAIARAVDEYEYARHVQAAIQPGSTDLADAVLAMPEMEAIRRTLFRLAERFRWDSERDLLINFGLPDDVIAWVLGGDQ